jgi:hypothetical protein
MKTGKTKGAMLSIIDKKRIYSKRCQEHDKHYFTMRTQTAEKPLLRAEQPLSGCSD